MPSMTVSIDISISSGMRSAHSLARKRSFIDVEVAVVGSALVGAAGQVEQVDERGAGVVLLDPGVEGGALTGGDRRRARHRTTQGHRERLGVTGQRHDR